ncbi:MAG TPA: hypothetical protein VGR28_11905 [Candidatus Thermoplasmatota archaeon]|jgi:hypothetical protein|nr:hypothetical protein [Candidatus Thermoplasmatota archaeon]
MVELDAGAAFGIVALVVACASLAYARTQAQAARRQAEAERTLAALEMNRDMTQRIFETRRMFFENEALARDYFASNPGFEASFEAAGGLEAWIAMRNILDGFQHIYEMRRAGLVNDYVWRLWMSMFPALVRTKACRAVFENGVARATWDPAFVAFMKPAIEGRGFADPLAPAPGPVRGTAA